MNWSRIRERSSLFLLAVGMFVFTAPATTAGNLPITLTFRGLAPGEDVGDYYAAGFGSLGSGPGPDYGVVFSPGAIVSSPGIDDENSVEFHQDVILDLDAPFSGLFSFYYQGGPGRVDFFSDPHATGLLVFSLPLRDSSDGFDSHGGGLPEFRSAVFQAGGRIDSLTFGGIVVPEPSTLLTIGIGLAGLGLTAGLRKRCAT